MPRVDISTFRGEEYILSGIITKAGVGYPTTTTANHNLLFTAKRRRTDPIGSAVLAKAFAAKTGYTVVDVALAVGGAYSVTIQDTDTLALVVSELLSYDLILIEPDGTRTVVDYGTWKITVGAA